MATKPRIKKRFIGKIQFRAKIIQNTEQDTSWHVSCRVDPTRS
jgi:hypothetical protein